jgi:NADH:ubiquinone oxidoreductase subunit F (NADH-binding)
MSEPSLLPRLLRGVGQAPMTALNNHLDVHGPLPDAHRGDRGRLIELIDRSGLTGYGGAAFPTARKLRAVASRRGAKVVVANGTEGEPASKKDRVLLREAPHMVLDGVAAVAQTVGARDAIIAICERDDRGFVALSEALAQRQLPVDVELFLAPESYLSGQESALVNLLNGGEAKPSFGARPYERGVARRPTVVQNVETLAHIALIARHGPDWFRAIGTPADPGSALVTVGGAVERPGVYEIAHGNGLAELLAQAGGERQLRAVLVGGYFGTWLAAAEFCDARLASEDLSQYGAALGAGVIFALGAKGCAVAETSRIADYFADESAGQCGPCVNGLGAIADTLQQVATGTADRDATRRLARWSSQLRRRGACAHPDGAARFVASSLRVFADEFHDHARHGACELCAGTPVLPVPALPAR